MEGRERSRRYCGDESNQHMDNYVQVHEFYSMASYSRGKFASVFISVWSVCFRTVLHCREGVSVMVCWICKVGAM